MTPKRCAYCPRKGLVTDPVQSKSDFYKDPSKADGFQARCKTCDKELRRGKPIGKTRSVQGEDHVKQLIAVVKKGKEVTLEEVCDRLDISPRKAREVISIATNLGVPLKVAGEVIGFPPASDDDTIQEVTIARTVSGLQKVGVISDTHFGSKHCLRAQLEEFVDHAYAQGVREILHPGDMIDGSYSFARFEQSHHGLDEQADDMIAHLPKRKGLTYHAITGNHDETFTEAIGVDVGPYLVSRFRQAGRNDLNCYGNRSAYLKIRGALIHLWHPRGGGSYARSYKLQKRVEAYASGEKPQILLTGHWHQYCHLNERGVEAFLCPTFEGGGSRFGKSLGGAPSIGGMILQWALTADGTMREFRHECRRYFERERPIRVDDMDGKIPVELPGVKSRSVWR